MVKNKFLRFCGILIFCAFAITGCAQRQIKNLDSKGKTIVCFGDSITFGYGVSPGEDYPSQLRKLVGPQVINSGVDGDTSVMALGRLEPDVFAKDPFLVIVEFTGNDFIKKIPMQETEKNISELVDKIQARGVMVAIADVSAGFFLRDYRIMLDRLASKKGAIFIPGLLSGIITTPSLKSDFIHPNAAGYKIVAQRVYRAISPYLNRKK